MLTIGACRWRVFKWFPVCFFQFLQKFDIFQNKNTIWEGRMPIPEPLSFEILIQEAWTEARDLYFLKKTQVVCIWFKASPSVEVPDSNLCCGLPFSSSGALQLLPSLHTCCSLCPVCCSLFLCLTPILLSGLSPNVTSSRKASYKPLSQASPPQLALMAPGTTAIISHIVVTVVFMSAPPIR